MPKSIIKLDWATHDAAKYACKKWHYSKCMPAGKMVKIGVWEDKKFIGVVLFSCGASPPMYVWAKNQLGLNKTELCELTRIALNKHKTNVSKINKIAFSFLKKQCPGIRLIVSFADLDECHHGGIYQAGNWVYCGISNAGGRQGFIIKGRKVHARSVGALSGENSLIGAKRLDARAMEIKTKGKHKYLMPLDSEMRERIQLFTKPYPKRVKQAMTGTTGTAKAQHLSTRSNFKKGILTDGTTRKETTSDAA